MTIAFLTAGGSGTRMNNSIPKQFITVKEIPIIIYTLQKFQNNPNVDKIVIACLEEWQTVLKAYIREFNITKVEKIVNGGETGIDSIRNCFESVSDLQENDTILIHDGNRPLVSDDIIEQNITSATEFGVTSTYIDIHDGIVKVDDNLNVQPGSISRASIKSTQTPHGFKYGVLGNVFSKIDNVNNYISLADAATTFGYKVALVKGSEINFKITTKNDLTIFEAIISKGSRDV